MSFITDICITYGSSLAPSGYHKLSLPDGGIADLNRGCGGDTPSFLWYSKNNINEVDGKASYICDLIICTDESSYPDGFEVVPMNILKGNKQNKAFICIRKQSSSLIEQKTNDDNLILSELSILYEEPPLTKQQQQQQQQNEDRNLGNTSTIDSKRSNYIDYFYA